MNTAVEAPPCKHRRVGEVNALWHACRAAKVVTLGACACCGGPLTRDDVEVCGVCEAEEEEDDEGTDIRRF
jgi:hypothetical protein